MPTHGNLEHAEQDHEKGRQERCGGAKEDGQKVINVDLGRVPDMPQTVGQTQQEACDSIPVEAGCTSTKIEGEGLV